MKKYVVLDKNIGQTPLQCMEYWRSTQSEQYQNIPLTYAGRLDPLASGKLLILIGNECKKKEEYLNLDKEYQFSVLFGMRSDTADVMGRLTQDTSLVSPITRKQLNKETKSFIGNIELPYPHFSSKTVQGKPLHTWAAEGRIGEIKIPTKCSTVYNLRCIDAYTETRNDVYIQSLKNINSIAEVTELRKALGNDFRRDDVRKDWDIFLNTGSKDDVFYIATFTCICSSGTYMRTLAEKIGERIGVSSLAYSINRTIIGKYKPLPFIGGIWCKQYRK